MSLQSIKKSADFAKFRTISAIRTKGLIVKTLPEEQITPPIPALNSQKIGIIVSKKIGNAVNRNYVKRKVKALLNQIIPKYGRENYNYLIIATQYTKEREFTDLAKDLKFALYNMNKTKILDNSNINNIK